MADHKELYTQVGQRLRKAREDLGITQKELASRIGLTRTSVTNVELGNQAMLLHTLLDWARVLKIDLAEVLGDLTFSQKKGTEIESILEGRPVDEQNWIKSVLGTKNRKRG